jgi:imidazolonepropionase-like amidohydrolase
MAKLVLDAGFTAGRGAAAAKPRLDVVAKKFINEGRFPGPRYLAAGPEITTVGGLGDASPSHIPHEGLNLGIVVSGPEEVRRTVRQLIKYGVDSIKLNLSGEEITGMGAEETPMSEEEVAMAVKEAKCRNKVLAAHARSSGSVKQCGVTASEHLSRLLRRRRGARHAGSQQGQAFRRPRDCLAHQLRAACRALGHQAGLEGGDAL